MVYEGHKTGMSETTFDQVVSRLLPFKVSSASCGFYNLLMYHVSLVVKSCIFCSEKKTKFIIDYYFFN